MRSQGFYYLEVSQNRKHFTGAVWSVKMHRNWSVLRSWIFYRPGCNNVHVSWCVLFHFDPHPHDAGLYNWQGVHDRVRRGSLTTLQLMGCDVAERTPCV